jgi:hypothetical protein
MYQKKGIIGMFFILISINLLSQVNEQKNLIGLGAGFCPARVIWIGNPLNVWTDINISPVIQVFYAHQLLKSVRAGAYLEYETASFSSETGKASRYNFGINWMAQYPEKPFHFQFGGYMGYGFVKADIWDQSLSGIDYGIMVGPAYEKNNLGIALHLQTGFAYYTSSGIPDEASYSKERILIKIYQKF